MKFNFDNKIMRQKVYVKRYGQCVLVSPFVKELGVFFTQSHRADLDREYGVRLRCHRVPLYRETGQNSVVFPAGMEPLVVEWLRRRNYLVEHENVRLRKLPQPPVGEKLSEFPLQVAALLRFIRTSEGGIIRFPRRLEGRPGVDPLVLIGQVIDAWPDRRILILCTREEEVRRVKNRLPGMTSIHGRVILSNLPKRIVSTCFHAAQDSVGLDSVDICFVLNATECFSIRPTFSNHELFKGRAVEPTRNEWFWKLSSKARLFGMLPDDADLTVQQRDILLMVFGFQTLTIPEHGHLLRKVVPAFFRHHHAMSFDRSGCPLTTKKNRIWKDPLRNRRLAQLAKILLQGDIDAIESCCRGLFFLDWQPVAPRVCLVADSLAHAYHLGKRLKTVPLLAEVSPTLHGWRQHQREWLHASQRPMRADDRLILATRSGLSRAGRCDVIVDATASSLPLSIPRELLLTDLANDPLLLVDVLDFGDALLDRWRQRREYCHWTRAFDQNSAVGALALFLRTGVTT